MTGTGKVIKTQSTWDSVALAWDRPLESSSRSLPDRPARAHWLADVGWAFHGHLTQRGQECLVRVLDLEQRKSSPSRSLELRPAAVAPAVWAGELKGAG